MTVADVLTCGHTLDQCTPGCPGWGGVVTVPDEYPALVAYLLSEGLISTPDTRTPGRAA